MNPSIVHVYPASDTYEHETDGRDCWCCPRVEHVEESEEYEEGYIVVHNPYWVAVQLRGDKRVIWTWRRMMERTAVIWAR